MSRMYKALEKAEKERISTLKRIKTAKSSVIFGESAKKKSGDRTMYVNGVSARAAEEFRKLRTLILQTANFKPMQTILVTSALPGEGKSTIASNLALAISHGVKEHALLIDCDLRNSHSNPLLRKEIAVGISDYLMGKANPTNLIAKTRNPKLAVIPSGSVPSNPVELVGSEKMRHLMAILKSQYAHRYIIIDSPPILLATEPIILSEIVDGVIIVVRATKTPREVVQNAINNINKEKILGIVLNQSAAKPSYYSSQYQYYYPQKKN